MVWDIVGLLQRSKKPLPRKPPEKSLKRGFRGLSAPGSKSSKKSKNENFQVFFGFLARFRLFFELFQPRGREAPRTPFRLFSGVFYGEAFLTPVEGQRCPNFWYRDLFFGIEILHSVVQHLDRPLPGINLSVLFWASTSCKVEVKEDLDIEKKIEKSRYLKKRHLDTN